MSASNAEKLHPLDLGIARFTEFSLTVILTGCINVDFYQANWRALVEAWPVLSTRMDPIRTKLLYSSSDRMHIMWAHKHISAPLREQLPEYGQDELPLSIDCSRLQGYFKFPAMVSITAPSRITKPAVCRLQVVQFKDAAVLKFTVQHPLCDAKGLYKIVGAYCDLLAGKKIPNLNPRPPLELIVTEEKLAEDTGDEMEPLASEEEEEEEEESASSSYFSKGWGSLLMSGVSHLSRKAVTDARVSKAVLVPMPVMTHWRAVADELGIRVSKNDLLMAWIYMCAIPKAGKSALKFTFVLNIEQFLSAAGDLHNPWCLVPADKVPEAVLQRIRSAPNQIETLLQLAKCFRNIIEKARSHKFVGQTLKDHAAAATSVMSPKGFGKSEPNIRVSSWSDINLWSLKFASGLRHPDGQTETVLTPQWIACNIDFCPAVAWANLSADDTVVTWSEPRGYWIQGRLHQEVWEGIAQSNAMVLSHRAGKE